MTQVEVVHAARAATTTTDVVRRWLLLALPTLAAFGPMLMLVRPFYAFRVVALLLAAVTVVAVVRSRRTDRAGLVARVTTWVALVWLAVGALGAVVWAADRHAAVSDLLSVSCGLAVVLSALYMTDKGIALRSLMRGWVVAFVAVGATGVWEIVSHHHMHNYILAEYLRLGIEVPFIAGPFGNPNLYALFMVMGLPVLLYGVASSRDRRRRTLFVAATLWLFVLMVYTGSRLGLVATVVAVAVWLACTRKSWRTAWGIVIGAGLIAVVAFSVVAPFGTSGVSADAPPPKLSNTSLGEMVGRTTDGAPNSGSVRLQLVRRGWDMLVDTHGLGVGPGNFGTWIDRHGARYALAGETDPHNAVVELATQYGVVVLVAALLLFVLALRSVTRSEAGQRRVDRPTRALVLAMAAGFPFYAMCNSTFWPAPTTWVALAIFLAAAAAHREALDRSAPAAAPHGSAADAV